MTAPKKKAATTDKSEWTLDEQLLAHKIEVPEGTTDEVKQLLINQAEALKQAKTEASEIADSAAREIESINAKLEKVKNEPKADGFGSFKNGGNTYNIVRAQVKAQVPGEAHSRIVTAEEFRTNVELQNVAIAEGWGIVQKIVKS